MKHISAEGPYLLPVGVIACAVFRPNRAKLEQTNKIQYIFQLPNNRCANRWNYVILFPRVVQLR